MGILFNKKKALYSSGKVSDVELPVNKYYLDISQKFKICKYVSLVLLVIFTVCMISVFRSEITVENLKYFVKYLDTSSNEYTNQYKDINYSTTGVLRTCVFKGDYAVVNDETLTMYSMYGVSNYSANHKCANPFLVKSDKYMLIYDLSGNTYGVYNAFSQLYTETLDYPISGAAVCDNGMYAIVTRTNEYRSAVYLYDENFKLISRILKEKYVTGVKFSADGKKLIITSVYDDGGDWASEISLLQPYSDNEDIKFTLSDDMALDGCMGNDGQYAVLSVSALTFYGKNNEKNAEYKFGNNVPFTYKMTEDYVMVAFNNNILGNKETVKIYDIGGSAVCEKTFSEKINVINEYNGKAYILTNDRVYIIDFESGEEKWFSVDSGCKNIIPYSNYILLVYQTCTIPIAAAELFE